MLVVVVGGGAAAAVPAAAAAATGTVVAVGSNGGSMVVVVGAGAWGRPGVTMYGPPEGVPTTERGAPGSMPCRASLLRSRVSGTMGAGWSKLVSGTFAMAGFMKSCQTWAGMV